MNNKLFFALMSLDEFKRISKYGRNDLCPCGSNKKFKKCHWLEYEEEKVVRRKQIIK